MTWYRYSGRNEYGKIIPRILKAQKILDSFSKNIFPCRVYDKNGKLKNVISEKEIIEKEIKKIVETKTTGKD